MKIKKKLRDVTREEYHKWVENNCLHFCADCPFKMVSCDRHSTEIWVLNKDMFSDKFLDQEIEIEVEKLKPKPTKEEIIYLKSLKPEYKWIVKNKDKCIYVFTEKPKKQPFTWVNTCVCSCLRGLSNLNNIKFKFLSWEDEEPTNIQELIKEYENE